MELRVKGFGSLVAAALLSFAPATKARADVWVYEVLTLRPEAPPYQAEAYHGALEPASADGTPAARVVGLWRFNDVGGIDALLADPSYRSLSGLHERTFDPSTSRSLERVRALAGPGE